MKALLQSLRDLGPTKLSAMAGVSLILIGFFAFLAFRGASPHMGLLYSNLAMEESGKIVQYLDTNNIPYEVKGGGTQIFVAGDEVGRIRLQLAGQGMPSANTGAGYELFDRGEPLGTSNFVQNVNLLRALEGELARTIGTMANIQGARVHIVTPKRELFTRDQKPVTASIALEMKGAGELNRQEIQAIRNLVATAVPGLDINRITIVDNKGRLLARGSGEDDAGTAASEADEFRIRYEQRMQERLVELLERTVGPGNVQVNVAADIDFDRIVRKSETFDPESQVARSVQNSSESEDSQSKDMDTNVSVRNNVPDPAAAQAGMLNQSKKERTDETTNFEISKVVENHVKEVGTVKKLSVAVLVNGTVTMNAETNEPVYTERTQEELDRIGRLVRTASGFDEKRGDGVEVVSMQFSDALANMKPESPLEWLKQDFHNILQTAILGVVAILAILLVIRPLVSRAIESSVMDSEGDEMDAIAGPDVAGQLTDQRSSLMGGDGQAMLEEDQETLLDLANIEGGVKSSSVRRITALIDAHPEAALNVLRSWIAGS